jgi:LytS/YehU family sensor histidine kinase
MKSQTGALKINITGEDLGDTFTVCVRDSGIGIPARRLAELGKRPLDSPDGNGSALYHLRQSLKLAFPQQSTMTINSREGLGTEVILTLPKRTTPW